MKSAVESLSPTRVRISIDVDFKELEPHVKSAYQTISEKVVIPGFRKGKVPAALIDQRVGRAAVLDEAINFAFAELAPSRFLERIGRHPDGPSGNGLAHGHRLVADIHHVRLAGRIRKRDGYVENLLGGADFNSADTKAVRGSFHGEKGDLSFDLIGNYQKDTPAGTAFKSINVIEAGTMQVQYLTGNVTSQVNNRTRLRVAYNNSYGKTTYGLVYRFDKGSRYSAVRSILPTDLNVNISDQFGSSASQYQGQRGGAGEPDAEPDDVNGRLIETLLAYAEMKLGKARATQIAAAIGQAFAFGLGFLGICRHGSCSCHQAMPPHPYGDFGCA